MIKQIFAIISMILLISCGGESDSSAKDSEPTNGKSGESSDKKMMVRVRSDEAVKNIPDVSSLEEYEITAENYLSQAEQLRDNRKYLDAIKKLELLLEAFPDSPEAPDAQVLIARIYMGYQNDFSSSVREFREVVTKYPKSNQAKNAQFMIGYIYANHLGDKNMARIEFQKFIDLYSGEVEEYFLESARAELKSLEEGAPALQVDSE